MHFAVSEGWYHESLPPLRFAKLHPNCADPEFHRKSAAAVFRLFPQRIPRFLQCWHRLHKHRLPQHPDGSGGSSGITEHLKQSSLECPDRLPAVQSALKCPVFRSYKSYLTAYRSSKPPWPDFFRQCGFLLPVGQRYGFLVVFPASSKFPQSSSGVNASRTSSFFRLVSFKNE